MNQEMEQPRVTEIQVRMDCNGCVQKIKRALHGITGIYDLYVDFPQQKITVIGWADPHKIVKAIKKTRKSAVICSHAEQSDQQASEPVPEGVPPEGGAPPPESTEQPQTEAAPPAEAQNELPQPPSQDNIPPPPPDNPPPESANDTRNQSTQTSKPKDSEEIHVVYHYPPDYGHRYAYGHYPQQGNGGQWQAYPSSGFGGETSQVPRPVYVTHSYNAYKPSPYVTEYAYPQSPPGYSYYSRPYNYNQVYYNGSNGSGNGNITSMFSEENPNACTIV